MDFELFERAAWENQAAGYVRFFGALAAEAAEPLLDAAEVAAGSEVLDLACGPGAVTSAAARRGATVIGADTSRAMLALATARHPGLRFEHGDAHALAYADASFDVVTISLGMLHFADPHRALREVHRTLRPGGVLAFTDWAAPGPEDVAYAVILTALERQAAPVALPPWSPLFFFADPERGRASLCGAGFEPGTIWTRLLRLVWRLPGPESLVEAFRDGSVRLGARIKAQPRARLRAIEAEVRAASAPYIREGGLELPTGMVLTRACKPRG